MIRRSILRLLAGLPAAAAALSAAAGTPVKGKPYLRVPAAAEGGDLANVQATVDGQPAKIERLKGPEDDLLLLVVLDLAGDIAPIEAARTAIAKELDGLPPNAWVSVMKAQDNLQVLLDPTADREAAKQAITGYAGGGKAGLLDTVESAARLGDRVLEKSATRVSVMYITDSNVYNYREDYTNPVINSSDSRDLSRRFPDQLVREKIQKLTDSLLQTEAPVSVVHLEYRVDTINEAYQRGLRQLAEATGGVGMFCRSLAEIPEAVTRVFGAARSQWSVFVELPPHKGRNIVVSLAAPERAISHRQRFSVRR